MFPIQEYEDRINSFYQLMRRHSPISDIKLSEEKWTLKEMIGHLIDSASNNHQRFIRLQLDTIIEFPAYDAEEWKTVTKIQDFDLSALIELWKGYNLFLLHLIKNISEDSFHNTWKINGEEVNLQILIEDYFSRHLNWHIELYKSRIAELCSA